MKPRLHDGCVQHGTQTTTVPGRLSDTWERTMSTEVDLSAVAAHIAALRTRYVRVHAEDLAGEMKRGALVIDTRPVDQRSRDGELPGSIVVDRNVLEWRLDPTSPHRLPQVTPSTRVIVVCDQGFSSTLAAVSLQSLGLALATDLVDGYQGLLSAGVLPRLSAAPLSA